MYIMESVSVTLLLKQAWIHNTNKAQSVLEICAFVRLMNSLKYLVAILFSIATGVYIPVENEMASKGHGHDFGRWDGASKGDGVSCEFAIARRHVVYTRGCLVDSAFGSELSIEMTCNLWCLGKGLTRSQQRGEKIVLFTLSQIRRCVSDGEGEV